jgi:hypothetical protein
MSYNSSKNNSSKNNSSNFSARKPYCAHCQNTGEPENVYTSHYPRSLPDRTGKTTVTCPKLQATECTYCYEFGHTRKFCPVIKKNQRAYEMEDRRNKAQEQQELEQKQEKHQKQRNLAGGFAMLAEDDSDNDEQKTKPQVKTVKEEWPALSVATASVATASVATASVALTRTQTIALPTVPPQNVTTGYAAMAAKPARVYSSQEPHTPISEYQVLNKGDRMTKTETPDRKYVPINQRSWLDEEDEEDEDW